MRKKKDKRVNKFTNKKHSTLGLISCLFDLVSLASLIGAFMVAYSPNATAGVYIGAAGMISLLLSIISMGIAIAGLKEESTFNNLPGLGLAIALIMIFCWAGMLALGALM